MPDADRAVFEMRCGKGTYVRSLARDLALALGTVGHAEEIRRLAVGPFAEADSIPLDKLETLVHSAPAQEYLLPIEAALDDIRPCPYRSCRLPCSGTAKLSAYPLTSGVSSRPNMSPKATR